MPKLNASSRIMYEEAVKMGITCTTFGDGETILMEYQDKSWYTRGSRTSYLSSVGKSIADYKPLTKKVLAHFNMPTAKFAVVSEESELENLKELAFPLVLKPVDDRHGRGVVVGIKTAEEAKAAFLNLGKKALFEEMLQGIEYRVVCINFKFVAAAFRKPAHVVGDGEHTITQLVEEKNKHPWRGAGHENNLSFIVIDEMVEKYLAEQNYTADSIPPKDTEVKLRKTANLSTGGEAWDVTAQVCEENRQLFEKIAKACDLTAIGIDIMCQSLEEPIVTQEKAGVIEVNASPGLRMHHYPLKGNPTNVAKIILEFALEKSTER